jgi:hypothetical protein
MPAPTAPVNFGVATVLGPHVAGDTSIALQSGNGAILPVAPFNAIYYDSTRFSDPSKDPNKEIIRVTAGGGGGGGDTLTVTRGQEGTAASSKNTAGSTYSIIAGLTAKGPESFGIGQGASPPAYVADIRSNSVSQIHLTDHDADDGGWLMALHGASIYYMAGCYYDGINFIAKETQAAILFVSGVIGAGALRFYVNSGLTVGNSFSLTERMRFDGSGNLGLVGVAPNVSVDTPGAVATRFASVTLANGLNSNIAISTSGNIRASGPTGAYSLGGFSGGVDGRELFFFNPLNQTVTIVNADASSTAANRIQTNTGGNVALRTTAPSCARFKYDSTSSLWILMNSN